MEENYPYQTDWENSRFWQKIYWLALLPFFGFLAYIALNGFNPEVITNLQGRAGVAFNIFGIFVLAGSLVTIRFQLWKCPRCEKPFHGGFMRPRIFARQCRHCDLRKYEGSTFERAAETGS